MAYLKTAIKSTKLASKFLVAKFDNNNCTVRKNINAAIFVRYDYIDFFFNNINQ